MKRPRPGKTAPAGAWLRFYGGSGLGILSLGVLGRNVLPFHWLPVLLALLGLAAGAVVAVGVVTGRHPSR